MSTALPRYRVVYVDHCARLSGAEIALARLLPALMDRVDPLVLLGEEGPLVARLESLGVEVDVLPLPARTRDLRKDTVSPGRLDIVAAAGIAPYIRRVARRVRAERADLVHTNSLKAALYGGVAARFARVPVVWHVRDRIAPDYLPGPAVKFVRGASMLLPDAVVANSRSTLSTLPRRTAGVVIDNPIVHDPYERRMAGHARDDAALTVGVLGRLSPWKGQHVFLEAFAQALGGTAAKAHLIGSAMFGEEDYEARLRRQVAELGIVDQVEFRGFRDDVEAELAQLDIVVHCSTSPEPFGQVVVEGMAAGLPVIASSEGGPAEIIHDEVDGLLVPPRNPALLAQALRRLSEDPELRGRLGAAGMAASARFAPGATADRMLAVYDRVLSSRSR